MSSFNNMSEMSSPSLVNYECAGLHCKVPQHELQSNSTQFPERYPVVNINCEMFNSSTVAESPNTSINSMHNVIVSVNEGVLKSITRTFFENGFMEALNEARSPNTAASCPMIASAAEYTYKVFDFIVKLRLKVFPPKPKPGIASIAKYSETRDWIRSYIRYIAWHPNCFKLAVAGCDDIVRIYTSDTALVPVLRNFNQKWITSMAWRPFTAAELAVACHRGVFLWTIDNNFLSISSSPTAFLRLPEHSPVSAVQWNADGTLLATSSISDADVVLWDIDRMKNCALKRVGPPCSLLKWSPDGSSLFTSTVGNVFRVWSVANQWTPERWTIADGTIQSAVWSPCGSFLLFVTSEFPILYRLNFFEEQIFENCSVPKQAEPAADLKQCSVAGCQVGGQPQSLAWDPNGHYLAINFKNSPCVAIFATSIQSFNLNISPYGYLTGFNTEYPSYICFQSKCRQNPDSILTIGWSSGRIQYFRC